jgi:lia operon protein LiaG
MNKLILAVLLLASLNAAAQEYSYKPKGAIPEIIVNVRNLYSDLEIIGTKDAEIRIIAEDYEGPPEKAAGLRPMSATGPDNSGIGLNIEQDGNTVIISGAHRHMDDTDYTIMLPANVRLRIDYSSFQSDDIIIRGMTNEVEIKSQVGDLTFMDVTGPLVASTLSANINVVFTELSQASPTALASISGDVDISLPADSKGNFSISTTSGEIYTDLDFDAENLSGESRRKGKGVYSGFPGAVNVNAMLNGGGVEVSLRSVSGDIFIRKAK